MKFFFAFIFFVALSATGASVYAAAEIAVTVDGEEIYFADQAPVLSEGRVLVPVRAVFERLGFDVIWGEFTQIIVLAREGDTVSLVIGDNGFVANGMIYASSVPPQIINYRTMLPIRAIVESVGYHVAWDEPTNTVQIFTSPPPIPDAITIPDRHITPEELAAWVANYHARGGINNFEREVIRLTNIERENAGQAPLEICAELMLSARFKAQSMYDLGYFEHTSPVYGAFYNISFEVFGIPRQTIGENLGRGHRTPEDVVQGWLDSPGHRSNLLSEQFTRIGVGFFEYTWAQKFLG